MEIIGALNTYLLRSIIVALPIYTIIKTVYFLIKKRGFDKPLKMITEFVLLVYLVGVIHLTVGLQIFELGLPKYFIQPNLIPLVHTFSGINSGVIEQIFYNMALFVPLGMLLPVVFVAKKWSFFKIAITAFGTSAIIEVLQFFTGRFCDIDDVIVNTAGAVVGFWGYLLGYFFYKKITCKTAGVQL